MSSGFLEGPSTLDVELVLSSTSGMSSLQTKDHGSKTRLSCRRLQFAAGKSHRSLELATFLCLPPSQLRDQEKPLGLPYPSSKGVFGRPDVLRNSPPNRDMGFRSSALANRYRKEPSALLLRSEARIELHRRARSTSPRKERPRVAEKIEG
jgi:hypothetical protein